MVPEVSALKKFCAQEKDSQFLSGLFCFSVPKIFVDGFFFGLWVLTSAWHRLHLHVLKFYAVESK